MAVDFLLNKSLYTSPDEKNEVGSKAASLLRAANVGSFDCFCTKCHRDTPFIVSDLNLTNRGGGLRQNNALARPPVAFAIRSVCQRCLQTYTYVFRTIADKFIKIGQIPSMADIAFGELRSIDKSLDAKDRRELGKALGLFSHDAALGAFAYLRRVFERLIDRAHERMKANGNEVADFDHIPMDKKIAALKDELPENVVLNSKVFSVLSLGLHELSDEECAHIFPLMKALIFQMLEKEEHKRKAEATERETEAALQKLLSSASPSSRSAIFRS